MKETRFWLWLTDSDGDFWHYMAVMWLVVLPVIVAVSVVFYLLGVPITDTGR